MSAYDQVYAAERRAKAHQWIREGKEVEDRGDVAGALSKYNDALQYLQDQPEIVKKIQAKILHLKNGAPPSTASPSSESPASDTVESTPVPTVTWNDVAGLHEVKAMIRRHIDLFRRQPQLRTSSKGLSMLFYGTPGTGKSLLAKVVANAVNGQFFSMTSGSVISKYQGSTERAIRDLFQKAAACTSPVVFFDEIDSLARKRTGDDTTSTRGIKTELLTAIDHYLENRNAIFIGATNCPWDLDEAIRRRTQKRIFIPLPTFDDRLALMSHVIKTGPAPFAVSEQDLQRVARATELYSGSDLTDVLHTASDLARKDLMASVRFVHNEKTDLYHCTANEGQEMSWEDIPEGKLADNPVTAAHLWQALTLQKATISQADLAEYENFTNEFGQKG